MCAPESTSFGPDKRVLRWFRGVGCCKTCWPAFPCPVLRFLSVSCFFPMRAGLRSTARVFAFRCVLVFFWLSPMSAGLRSAARLLVPARSCLFWLSPLCAYVPLPGSYVPLPVSSWPSSYVCWPTFRCPGVYVPLRSCLLLWLAYVREGVTLETSRELRDISAVWAASCQTG